MTLLKDPVDSWTKAMAKIAEDAVHRMFDHLSRVEGSRKLDKELLLECFVKGRSSSKFYAEIKNKKRDPGRQIYVKQSKIWEVIPVLVIFGRVFNPLLRGCGRGQNFFRIKRGRQPIRI